jgi:hypothetical protein
MELHAHLLLEGLGVLRERRLAGLLLWHPGQALDSQLSGPFSGHFLVSTPQITAE